MCQLFAQSSSSHGPYISIEWHGDTGEGVWGRVLCNSVVARCLKLRREIEKLLLPWRGTGLNGSARVWTTDYFRSPVAGLTPVNPPLPSHTTLSTLPSSLFYCFNTSHLSQTSTPFCNLLFFPIEASRKTLIAFFTLVLPLRLTRTWF